MTIPAAGPPPTSPRAALVADLAEHVARLVAAGDLDGARLTHEAIGKLLVSAAADGPVVDLDAERRRRSR